MQPMPLKKRRFYFYVLSLVFFLAIPVLIFYESGYRLGDSFNFVKTGGIYIYSPESGSEIYLNGDKIEETGFFLKDFFVDDLKPGKYSVLISKEKFWPWAKNVTIKEGMVAEAIAFLIPKDPEGETVPKNIEEANPAETETSGKTATTKKKPEANPEYLRILSLFEEEKINKEKVVKSNTLAKNPADESPATSSPEKTEEYIYEKVSPRGKVGLWREGNQILAKWLKSDRSLPYYFCEGNNENCREIIAIFNSASVVRSLDFYPGRDDVVVIAVENGIFAIEIDSRKTQNFQPIYKGVDPYFIIDGNTFYVKDKDAIIKIKI
ncbi:MAG: PEGA domain-containing protein [Patescibacteria group bacterium]